jgi:hypothetical protein
MDNDNSISEYRKFLIAAEQKSQEDFDKTILSLSGGALGISFVFLKDIIGSNPVLHPSLLIAAWIAWALSNISVLFSFHLSHLALRHAISQVDNGTIYDEPVGGKLSKATAVLNQCGAILFFIGVCSITAFAGYNISNKGVKNVTEETSISPAKASTSPIPLSTQNR